MKCEPICGEDMQARQLAEICKRCEAYREEIHNLNNRKIELEEMIAKAKDDVFKQGIGSLTTK